MLDKALATPGPVLIEAVVDPLEPPLPANVSLKQAAKFAESLAKGEPSRSKIALPVLSDKVREMIEDLLRLLFLLEEPVEGVASVALVARRILRLDSLFPEGWLHAGGRVTSDRHAWRE